MSLLLTISTVIFFIFVECKASPTRFRRQHAWGVLPYYESAQYYESQPHQWSSQYQNNQNYYSPYFYGYQHQNQQSWQNPWQNSYPSQYNRPSWISESGQNNNGYATVPPNPSHGSYARPNYLATMQPKPTLSPVIIERTTLFVTPLPVKPTENDKHPTFLERLGVATSPFVSTVTNSELEKSINEEEHEKIDDGKLLPERVPEETEISEKRGEKEEEDKNIIEFVASTTFPQRAESTGKDSLVSTTELFNEAPVEETTTTLETTTELSTTTELTTEESTITIRTTTPTPQSTTKTIAESTTTTISTIQPLVSETKIPNLVKDVKPVTLLAFQKATDEATSIAIGITQPTIDQTTSVGDLNEIGEASGLEPATTEGQTNLPTFASGIVGLRAPPLPKVIDPEKFGLRVTEWTDTDNEVRRELLTQ